MCDRELLASAILDIKAILSAFVEPGPCDADGTIMAVLGCSDDVPTAAERVRDDFWQLLVVK